jgi:hypothetical protein
MVKLLQLLSVFGILFSSTSQAQYEKCASSHMHDKLVAEQPDFAAQILNNENEIQSIIARKKSSRRAEEVLTIPLVIHVIHTGEAIGVGNNISDEQITSGVDQLNAAFRNENALGVDVKVEFQLAILDPNCTSTTGINRVDGSGVTGYSTDGVMSSTSGADETAIKALSLWSNADYYNIWLVSEFDGNDGGGGTQGFAYFPGASSARDGAMIMNTAWGSTGTVNLWNNKGSTGIHEIGHALDLYHTFEGDEDAQGTSQCPTGTCGSDLGDCCDDTSPHQRSSSDCDSLGMNSCTGLQNDAVITNYMDYSNQDCQIQFTSDQKDRMRAALEGPRGSLLLSKALATNLSGFVAPVAASCAPVSSADGTCCGVSGVMLAEITGIVSHATSYTKNDGGYVNESGSCIKTAILTKGSTYQFKTNIWFNAGQAVAWIDYNNDGSFDSTEKIYDMSIQGDTDDSISFTVPLTATVSNYIRMRVMCDVSNSITSACHNPRYGQAEDYPVLIENATQTTNSVKALSHLEIGPNPFNNQLKIINNKETLNYAIVDITGRLIQSGSVTGQAAINTSDVPSGIFSIVLQSTSGITSKKIVK